MALYRLSADVVKRSGGRSVVACVAYRAGESLEDERTGQTFDYSRKRGVLHEAIIAPENAPAWMTDRAKLWNGVEAAEKRKDAQLARDVLLALPHELTDAQRVELVEKFVRDEFVSKGMVADIAIHAPGGKNDERNFHAHVTLTMRKIDGDHFGNKCREWNKTDQLEQWRADWASRVNHSLELAGVDDRVDHRSWAAQGIDREPGIHLGPAVMEMERRGIETGPGSAQRAILERNKERARTAHELQALDRDLDLRSDDEKGRRRAAVAGAPEWTEHAGMVAQQASALEWAERAARLAKEQSDARPQATTTDKELAAFLKERAAERQQLGLEKDDDFGLDL